MCFKSLKQRKSNQSKVKSIKPGKLFTSKCSLSGSTLTGGHSQEHTGHQRAFQTHSRAPSSVGVGVAERHESGRRGRKQRGRPLLASLARQHAERGPQLPRHAECIRSATRRARQGALRRPSAAGDGCAGSHNQRQAAATAPALRGQQSSAIGDHQLEYADSCGGLCASK